MSESYSHFFIISPLLSFYFHNEAHLYYFFLIDFHFFFFIFIHYHFLLFYFFISFLPLYYTSFYFPDILIRMTLDPFIPENSFGLSSIEGMKIFKKICFIFKIFFFFKIDIIEKFPIFEKIYMEIFSDSKCEKKNLQDITNNFVSSFIYLFLS